MSTLIANKNTLEVDKKLLNNIVGDVLQDYIELKEDENTRRQIESDTSMQKLTQNLKTTLGKL